MLKTIGDNKTGAVLGGIFGAYLVSDFAIKKFKVQDKKAVLGVFVTSTVLGIIGGALIQKMVSKKKTSKYDFQKEKSKILSAPYSDAKNDPMFNPKG